MAPPPTPPPPLGVVTPPPPSLRVIGAVFGRTGTHSRQAALELLLGGPCYHMDTVVQPSRLAGPAGDVAVWEAAAASGGAPDWGALFDARGVRAAVDFPVCLQWRQLAVAYPHALVVLTVRPADDWARSWAALTATIPRYAWLMPLIPRFRRAVALVQALIYGPVFGVADVAAGEPVDAATAVAAYERHVADVVAAIPADRLLVLPVGSGWAPLCAALRLPIPGVPSHR